MACGGTILENTNGLVFYHAPSFAIIRPPIPATLPTQTVSTAWPSADLYVGAVSAEASNVSRFPATVSAPTAPLDLIPLNVGTEMVAAAANVDSANDSVML